MKASVSPKALFLTLVLSPFLVPLAGWAQDTLVLTNGQRREGQVLGVTEGRIKFKSGPAETSLPLEQVSSVLMAPPQTFEQALTTWKTGDAAKTLPILKPLVQNFIGLPAPWVQRAAALLGEVLLESGDTAGAEAAFSNFQKFYPNATGQAEIGLARLAVEKKNFDEAATKLAPIVESAKKTLLAESGKSAELGQACYLMGTVLENQGKYPEAMEHYLLAVTVFYEDPVVSAKAQARADSLAKEKNASVP
jgi:TolA-binding protein